MGRAIGRWVRRRLAKATEWPKPERQSIAHNSNALTIILGVGIVLGCAMALVLLSGI